MYSGAVFSYHLMHAPLVANYDVYAKLDVDVTFQMPIPKDFGAEMQHQVCVRVRAHGCCVCMPPLCVCAFGTVLACSARVCGVCVWKCVCCMQPTGACARE